jgi:hypothetical protein
MALSMVMKQESVYPENELDPANFKDYNGSLLIFIETGCVEVPNDSHFRNMPRERVNSRRYFHFAHYMKVNSLELLSFFQPTEVAWSTKAKALLSWSFCRKRTL